MARQRRCGLGEHSADARPPALLAGRPLRVRVRWGSWKGKGSPSSIEQKPRLETSFVQSPRRERNAPERSSQAETGMLRIW